MSNYIIIDRNTMSRDSITALIYQMEKNAVVFESGSIEEASMICDFYQRIDIVIFSSGESIEKQIDQFKSLHNFLTYNAALIITNCSHYEQIEQFLKAGATSVLSASGERNELITAIRSVISGQIYVSKNFINRQAEKSSSDVAVCTKACPDDSITNKLTTRQQQVLNYLSKGYANKLIAYELGVSEGTVKLHVSSILAALNVTNRTEAAMRAGSFMNLNAH